MAFDFFAIHTGVSPFSLDTPTIPIFCIHAPTEEDLDTGVMFTLQEGFSGMTYFFDQVPTIDCPKFATRKEWIDSMSQADKAWAELVESPGDPVWPNVNGQLITADWGQVAHAA